MEAAVCRTFGEPLTIEQISIADPGAGEVRVRLKACAICHSDLICIAGGWGGELPTVYGHEAAGIIESVGSGVAGLETGEHVVVTLIRSCGHCHYCSREMETQCETLTSLDEHSPLRDANGSPIGHGLRTGGFAELALVDASQVCVISPDIPFDSASLLACGVITGFGAVINTAQLTAGATVAVIGCGGVGLNSIQGAVFAAAQTIIALDPVASKRSAALSFGATHALDNSDADLLDQVLALTHGRGVDCVFVTVGVKPAIDQSLSLLARGGSAVIVGMPVAGVLGEYDPGLFAANGQRLLGSKMGSSRVATDVPRLANLYLQGDLKLDELISGRYPLADINQAIASTRSGDTLRNVIVFP